MRLGKLVLQSKALLSPLEGVSDVGFRKLCYENGAGITWTEMLRCDALLKKNKATLDLIDTHDPSTLTGIQLLAKSADELLGALNVIEKLAQSSHPHFQNIVAVDLNFGCPSSEVIREGAGPTLLKRRKRIGEIFGALTQWRDNNNLNNSIRIGAVGAKIRLGLNQKEQIDHKVYMKVLEAACEFKLDYLVVHGRNAQQRSSEPATYEEIGAIKRQALALGDANIKIIANGDVCSKAKADAVMKLTGCDGVMIARHAILNPWVFRSFIEEGQEGGQEAKLAAPSSQAGIASTRVVQDAMDAYSRKTPTKSKYSLFHAQNFSRLMARAEAQRDGKEDQRG